MVGKHRHAVDTGYARGEETRARIVTAALKMFGERGFEGASTRDIAAAAGVNAPALQYYFDNKEGVYRACVEHILGQVRQCAGEAVERAEQVLARDARDGELIDAFCAIQAQMVDLLLTGDAAGWRLFMARLQAGEGPVAAFKITNEGITKRIYDASAAIVGRLLGRPPDDEETLIRAMTVRSQVTIFLSAPRTFLARLNWDSVDAGRLALLKRIIGEQTATLLRTMVATRMTGTPRRAVRRNTKLARR